MTETIDKNLDWSVDAGNFEDVAYLQLLKYAAGKAKGIGMGLYEDEFGVDPEQWTINTTPTTA